MCEAPCSRVLWSVYVDCTIVHAGMHADVGVVRLEAGLAVLVELLLHRHNCLLELHLHNRLFGGMRTVESQADCNRQVWGPHS